VQAEPVTQMHRLSSTKALILKRNYGNFKLPKFRCCFTEYSVVSLFWCAPRSDKLLMTVHSVCIEFWCVPSATCGSWWYQRQNWVLSIGVFVGLIFNSFFSAPSVCSFDSSNPRTMFVYVIAFVYVSWSETVKVSFCIFRTTFRKNWTSIVTQYL
jgi:hypothetical protein